MDKWFDQEVNKTLDKKLPKEVYKGVDNITTTFYQIHNRMLVVTTVYFSLQFFETQYKRSASKHPELETLHGKVLQKCLNQN